MRINIISYEPAGGWILYDYAEKLASGLRRYDEDVVISHVQALGYDVTFHVNYWGLRAIGAPGVHCTLLTHIDTKEKFDLVNSQALAGVWGLCMSEETCRRMNTLTGVERFVSFPPPAMIASPPRAISILVASRCYQDGRKNEQWLLDFILQFPPAMIQINIIGEGWGQYIVNLEQLGFKIDYYNEFNRDTYTELLKKSDYLLVTGFDEGALSTLDAILYDTIPIVTAQGYHLEQNAEMLFFASYEQLINIAKKLLRELNEKEAISLAMTDWDGFAKKHIDFWKTLVA